MSENTEQWLARIGSKEAMEERQKLRAVGKLNPPIRGARGLRNVVAKMGSAPTTEGHQWPCECAMCRPWLWNDGAKIDTDRDDLKHKYTENPPEKIPTNPLKKQRKKWSDQRGRSSN
jgi:hypothetical protein